MGEFMVFAIIILGIVVLVIIWKFLVEFWPVALVIVGVLIAVKIMKRKETTQMLMTSSMIDEMKRFFTACQAFKTESGLICIATITEDSAQKTICAYIDIGEAVTRPSTLGSLWENDKFHTFINPADAYDLIDSIDIQKVRDKFGKHVCIKPSEIDNEGIVFYLSWPIPSGVNIIYYMKGIEKRLAPYLSIKRSKHSKTYMSVDF